MIRKLLCRFRQHRWNYVSLVSPIILKDSKGAVAMEIYNEAVKQGKITKENSRQMELSIIECNTIGYLNDESVEVLETAGKLTKLMREVYGFRFCRDCGKVEYVNIDTKESNLFKNTLAYLFAKKLYSSEMVMYTAKQGAASKEKPCSLENTAGMAKEQIPSAFKRNAQTVVMEKAAEGFVKNNPMPPESNNKD